MRCQERGNRRAAGESTFVVVALLGDPTGREGENLAAVDAAVQRSAVVVHSYIHEDTKTGNENNG